MSKVHYIKFFFIKRFMKLIWQKILPWTTGISLWTPFVHSRESAFGHPWSRCLWLCVFKSLSEWLSVLGESLAELHHGSWSPLAVRPEESLLVLCLVVATVRTFRWASVSTQRHHITRSASRALHSARRSVPNHHFFSGIKQFLILRLIVVLNGNVYLL